MPHPRSTYDRDYYYDDDRRRPYSPSPTNVSYDSDPYDRYGRAVQPYQSSRRQHAVQPYYDSSRPLARRRSDSSLGEQRDKPDRKEQGKVFFKDHGAELIGAAAGGYAGHRAGDDHLKTASGAAVGAIGGAIVERGYKKWSDHREEKKGGVGRGRYSDDSDYSDYDSRGRYSRSTDRGRARSQSGWREKGRQLKRSLSRKRVDERDDFRDGVRSRQERPQSWRDLGREIKRNVSRRRQEKRRDDDGYYSDY